MRTFGRNLPQLTIGQFQDRVGAVQNRLCRIVGDQQYRDPVQPQDQCLDFGGGDRVQMGGALIQQQHRRPADQGPGYDNALLFPAGQGGGVFPQVHMEPVGVGLDPGQQLQTRDLVSHLGLIHGFIEADIVIQRIVKEKRLLL